MTTAANSAPASSNVTLFPWVSWKFSLIFAVALIGIIGTMIYDQVADENNLELKVIDQESGDVIAGARIQIGDAVWVSDRNGRVKLPENVTSSQISVTTGGYQNWVGDPDSGGSNQFTVPLAALDDQVAVSDSSATQSPVATDTPASEVEPTRTTESSGTPTSKPNAVLLSGGITNSAGKPVQGARVVVADQVGVTGADGLVSIELDEVPADSITATIIAPGYLEQVVDIDPASPEIAVVLELHQIKAIYLNPNISTTEEDVDRLIQMIDATELNAVVIDIKEELIFYDSKVPFFVDEDVVRPIYDINEMLAKFQDRGIYTIARLVVFKDSQIAENRPDIAVLNNQTGDLWRDVNGVAWVNPMVHELWEANTDLALEAAQFGFDEIQFDYVRFPTDGDFTTMDFGLENTQEVRERSIEKFLQMAEEKVHPTGAKLSADVFGYTMLVDDDLGIGQNFANLAQYVDYLSPMIYPSHFPNGSIAVDGHPNDFPYETIEISMRLGRDKLDGNATQMRPWLQDFDYFDLMPYGDAEVRAQIDATNDIGASGWMLWDPNNQYHPGALLPDENAPPATPAATLPSTPSASPPAESTPVARPRRRR